MNSTPSTTRIHGIKNAAVRSAPQIRRYLKLTFITGPKNLLTSRISIKCAAAMVVMCAPALLFCSILTIPAIIFQSPDQNAYFQFSRVLESDPTRWFVLLLAGICAIMSLAFPATIVEPGDSDFY